MTPPRKQPKRARRMWAYAVCEKCGPNCIEISSHKHIQTRCVHTKPFKWYTPKFFPVCVIPTDPASVEEMMERAAKVLYVEAIGRFNDMNKKALAPYARPPTLYTMQARAVVRDLLGLKGRK